MPIYETGHARNIENFETLISFVTAWGSTYDPANANIALTNLTAKLAAAKTTMADVGAALSTSKLAINDREDLFGDLRKLATRVINSFEACGATPSDVADARTINRKLAGARKTPAVQDDPATPEDESAASHSASQQSYTQLVEHLDALITLVTDSGVYTPNEAELDVLQLTNYSTALKTANTAVINTYAPLSNARIARDSTLYDPTSGLVDLALLVKKYVKSIYGADAPEYKQVADLPFWRPNK
jgi:hypothetical protein